MDSFGINTFKEDYQALKRAIQSKVEIGKALLETKSNAAICAVLLENDHSANKEIRSANANRKIFDSIIEASVLPALKHKMIIGHYIVFHALKMTNIRKKNPKENGFLSQNSIIMRKISPEECIFVTEALDPSKIQSDETMKLLVHNAFERFVESILTLVHPVERLQQIKSKVSGAFLNYLVGNVKGKRFFDTQDELLILSYNVREERIQAGKVVEIVTTNEIRNDLADTMAEKGLNYRPICKTKDAHVHILSDADREKLSKKSEDEEVKLGKGIFVLPIKKPLKFLLMNYKDLTSELKFIGDYLFSIQISVSSPAPNGKTSTVDIAKDVKTEDLISWATIENGVASFEIFLDTDVVKEPQVGEILIRSCYKSKRNQVAHLIDKCIILPKGCDELKVTNEEFGHTLREFVESGRVEKEDAEIAFGGELPTRPDEVSQMIDNLAFLGIDET